MKDNQFILSVLVNNQFGVLTRVSGLFARRCYNIDSLNVGETEDPAYSRMTIIASGDEYIKNQIIRQLEKLYDVKSVKLLESNMSVTREHMLIKLRKSVTSSVYKLIEKYGAKITDEGIDYVIVEIVDKPSVLDSFITNCVSIGILEMCRAGALALEKEGISLVKSLKN